MDERQAVSYDPVQENAKLKKKVNEISETWSHEKMSLEERIKSMTDQLDNIKGRRNRQSKQSQEKMRMLAEGAGRATAGEYQLETIQEINDEVMDIDFKSDQGKARVGR